MAHVFLPPQLTVLTNGQREMEIDGATLRDVIDELERRYPGMAARLLEGDRLRRGLAAAVDSVVEPGGLDRPVAAQSELHFIPAVSGGRGEGVEDRKPGTASRRR